MNVSLPVTAKSSTKSKDIKTKTDRIRAKKEVPDMANKKTMTPDEIALLQAKHRQEEAEARNRRKERNARTHRLIQEGAELESVVPEIKDMSLQELRHFLLFHLQRH
jgi:rRNA pseudouridine-1189 N-methylase Emg1 (Nep1/Mra1 family)